VIPPPLVSFGLVAWSDVEPNFHKAAEILTQLATPLSSHLPNKKKRDISLAEYCEIGSRLSCLLWLHVERGT
jgi:hypothetical protein